MSAFLHNITTAFIALITGVVSFFVPATQTPLPSPEPATSTSPIAILTPTTTSVATEKPETRDVPPLVSAVAAPPPAQNSTVIIPNWDNVNERTRKATINIICTSVAGGLFNPISGSGAVIDPRGVILVNAHLAQYLLLKDYPSKDSIECVGRIGSPAVPRYRLTLLYFPKKWADDHYKEILEQSPLGTGENDYALMLITSTTDPSGTLPSEFPFLETASIESEAVIGHPVIISAYPAGFLGGTLIQTSLFLSSAPANIQDVYTFTEDTIDLLSLGGSVVAQQGSSGGAVVTGEGKLAGIIVTSSQAPSTNERDLNAITLSHINRSLKKETGFDLREFLSQDIRNAAENFAREEVPVLVKPFVQILQNTTP